MNKYVMTQAVCKEGMDLLKDKAKIYVADNPNPNNYLNEMKDADALIVRIASCDKKVIENSENLKVIGRTGVGYDSVDVNEATKRGIPVVITPGANSKSVAEHTIGMIFELSKKLIQSDKEMRRGNWEVRNELGCFEIFGKKLGIIGLGAIGYEVAKIADALGMEINWYDPFPSHQTVDNKWKRFDDYRDLLSEVDFLSLHVPLLESTKNMISMKELEKMKNTSYLINCSRGGIINENELIKAVNEGIVAGAALDVFEEEPLRKDSKIVDIEKIILTPHSAAQTREAVVNMATMCVEGCEAILSGRKWPFVADIQVYNHPFWKDKEWA